MERERVWEDNRAALRPMVPKTEVIGIHWVEEVDEMDAEEVRRCQ